MNHTVCCFTGHREIPLLRRPGLKKKLRETIKSLTEQGVREFRCGGALGFDTMAALAVLDAKKNCPNLRLVLMLPCRTQTKGWKPSDIKIYCDILRKADEVIFTSEHYSRGCMHIRNRRLVEGSSVCVAYCERDAGGTAYTVRYAREHGLTILNLGRG